MKKPALLLQPIDGVLATFVQIVRFLSSQDLIEQVTLKKKKKKKTGKGVFTELPLVLSLVSTEKSLALSSLYPPLQVCVRTDEIP